MKTKYFKTKVLMSLMGLATVLSLAACNKGSSNNSAPPPAPVVVPTNCPTCVPGGQVLYGGPTTSTNGSFIQAQFQVSGAPSGSGPGSITGQVNFNGLICNGGTLSGPYQIQMAQQGMLNAGVFAGYVTLVGPAGSLQSAIKTVPASQGQGLFELDTTFCYGYSSEADMNF